MAEDGSDGRGGGFQPLLESLRRAKREVGVAVGHGVEGLQNWVEERWLPVRLVVFGGFSWTISHVFGWLLSLFVEFGSWLALSLTGITATSSTQILLLFFVVYILHSSSQTKLIWDVKTKIQHMGSESRSNVRTDGGGDEGIWLPAGAVAGIIGGATIGWSFGIEGVFVGASVGWVLGDEYDRWFDEKFMETGYTSQDEERHTE